MMGAAAMRGGGLRRDGGALLAFLAAACGGCASPPAYVEADHHYFSDRPRELLASYAGAEADRGANALVGIDKMLSAALLAFDWAEAERLAELASTRVNIFLAGEPGEKDALSFLGREKDKPFKGEPHERAMVDFYLGLLRLRRQEHEGALNAFLSAMQKDRGIYRLRDATPPGGEGAPDPRTVIYAADYATFSFLAAVACRRIDEPEESARHLEEARRLRPELSALFEEGMRPETNLLMVIEAGHAPVKVLKGTRGEVLGYHPGGWAEVQEARVAGESLPFGMSEDLYVQATTLGGRAVDELNRMKAAGQEAIRAAGFATAAAGGVLADAGENDSAAPQSAGLAAMAAGIAAMVFADAAVDPSADLRSWSTLPDRLYLAVGRVPPGEHTVEITARSESGDDQSQRWKGVPVAGSGTTILWFRLLPRKSGGVYPGPRLEAPQFARRP